MVRSRAALRACGFRGFAMGLCDPPSLCACGGAGSGRDVCGSSVESPLSCPLALGHPRRSAAGSAGWRLGRPHSWATAAGAIAVESMQLPPLIHAGMQRSGPRAGSP